MSKPAPPPYSPPGVPSYNQPNPPYPTGEQYNPSGGPYNPSNHPYNQSAGYYQPPVITQPAYQEVHFHPPQENTVIITNGPVIARPLGPHSQVVVCPICHHTVPTKVECETSSKTHLFALLLCLCGCWPCCFIPYCMDSCQDRNHYCVHCGALIGKYSD